MGRGYSTTTHSLWTDGTSTQSSGENQFLIVASGGVGIGKNDPQSQLDVQGTVTADRAVVDAFKMAAGAAAGYVLKSDANGTATWQSGSADHTGDGTDSFIGGGLSNDASGTKSTIGAGESNEATNSYATVAGGQKNNAFGNSSSVGGGESNNASGKWATVPGGAVNTASAMGATAGGGLQNRASAQSATVGGGSNNTASATGATVAGGVENVASGEYSFAVGHKAQALHENTFVWSASGSNTFSSTDSDQFLINSGKVGINTNSPGDALEVNSSSGKGITISSPRPVFTLDDTDANGWTVEMNAQDLHINEATLGTVMAIDSGTGSTSFNGVIESTTGGLKFPDGTTQTTASSAVWSFDGNDIYYEGDVGINTTNPAIQAEFAVNGTVAIGESYASNQAITAGFTYPDNGLIVEGSVGIGTFYTPDGLKLDVKGEVESSYIMRIENEAQTTGF